MLEIVNSNGHDGTWSCEQNSDYINGANVHPDDRGALLKVFESGDRMFNVEFRLWLAENNAYVWVNLSGSIAADESGEFNRIVGCVHSIQQRKLLEEEQWNQQKLDSTTGFYRLEYGLEAVRTARIDTAEGMLLLTDIRKFADINKNYGLIYGDLVLEHLASIIRKQCETMQLKDTVCVRAGADQMLLWLPGQNEEQIVKLAEAVRTQLAESVNSDYLTLTLVCGMAKLQEDLILEEGIGQVERALMLAKQRVFNTVRYSHLTDGDKELPVLLGMDKGEPFEKLRKLRLSSLALNLFDRGSEIRVSLDMLAWKLQERYELKNLIITKFNLDFLVNTLTYHWKKLDSEDDWDGMQRCKGTQYHYFAEHTEWQKLLAVTDASQREPIAGKFLDGKTGMIFHMADNRRYTGSIIFIFAPETMPLFENETEQKGLEEIASIIQNRINLQRHDLSAQAKSEFLARMSHEIRTPMNGIIGMTEIALKEGQKEEKRIECLNKIRSSSNYLLSILNDILDMSKIESGKMSLVCDACNLRQTEETLVSLIENRMNEKQLAFSQDIRLEHDWFICDELRISQIMMNLLSNAVKYSNVGGSVQMTIQENVLPDGTSDVFFAVQDNGVGIEKEKQELIFQSFEQADDSEKARRQGTGLGLAISSHLVHMMDSEIHLESEPGVGSVFHFVLRLQPVKETVAAKTVVTDAVALNGKRILVVEDNDLNREIIQTILEEYSVTVEAAHNGLEAVTRMKETQPGYYDLILMDIMMPVMDGLEATKEIRRLPRADCQQIPIIAMSANAFDEDVKRSLASGMNVHLSKPINVEKLIETLASSFHTEACDRDDP